jgi:outer membrane receptor protein involved in Fe transport
MNIQNTHIKKPPYFARNIINLHILAACSLLNTYAHGQDAIEAESTADKDPFEVIMVVGSGRPRPAEEATIAVSALAADKLDRISTRSNPAEALKAIPGITIETSGNSDFNLMSRGFPQNFSPAGNIYVQIREDGLPILENPLFVDAQYFSSGPGLERVEGVRGSTAGIWGTNSPGALINFIMKEGDDDFEGQANFTYGPQGLYNFQSNISGPLADYDDLYYSLSANYIYDKGVRERQLFPLNEGGEIFGNIVKNFDAGRLKLSAKIKDVTAHQVRSGIVDYSNERGFTERPEYDIRKDNFVVNDLDRYSLPQPGGGALERNFSDGNSVGFYYVGAELELDLTDQLTSTTLMRYTEGDVSTDIDINLGNSSIRDFADGIKSQIGADTYRVEYLTGGGRVFNEADVDEIGGNGLYAGGNVFITWDWDNTNFFLQEKLDYETEDNFFSGAVYLSRFTRNRKGQFSTLFHEAKGNPRSLQLIMERDGEDIVVTNNGFAQYSTNNRDEESKSLVAALILEDEYQVSEKLAISGSFRYEYKDISNNEARFAPVDLDGNPDTFYDNAYLAPTGKFVYVEDSFSETAYSVAASYQFTEEFGMFARYSDLFLSKTVQDYIERDSVDDVTTPTQDIDMLELGFKYYTRNFGLFATLYAAELNGIPDNQFVADSDGNITTVTTFGGSKSKGLELTANYVFNDQLTVDLTTTLLNAEYDNTFVEDADGISIDVTGKQVIRQPKVNVRITPVWQINDNLEAFAAYQYFGDRTGNELGNVEFDAYTLLDLGLTWYSDGGDFFIKGEVINALDEAGQQEGAVQTRNITGSNDVTEITLGRFTSGISAQVTFGLSF